VLDSAPRRDGRGKCEEHPGGATAQALAGARPGGIASPGHRHEKNSRKKHRKTEKSGSFQSFFQAIFPRFPTFRLSLNF
jgi:hypothetical protein